MTKHALIVSVSLAGTLGCADAPSSVPPDLIQPPSPSARAAWGEVATDPLTRALVRLPPALPRFLTRLRIEATFADIESVTLLPRAGDANGAPLPLAAERCARFSLWADETLGRCAVVGVEPGDLQPEDQLRVTARADHGAEVTLDVRVPPAPADESLLHFANVTAPTADGTIWSGSPIAGLVGLTADGELVVVRGADLWPSSSTLAHRGPRTDDVFALAPTPDRRGLWVGAAVDGVSYFEPGSDPASAADDRWAHLPARDALPSVVGDWRDAPRAVVSDGLAGAWVATENGLLHVTRAAAAGTDGSSLVAHRVLEGAFGSVAVAPDGTVWAGAIDSDGGTRGLVHLAPQGTPDEPADDQLTMGLREVGVIRAIVARADGVWLGTTRGLYRVESAALASGTLVAVAMNAAVGLRAEFPVVSLGSSEAGVLWVAARDACVPTEPGRLLRVAWTNETDVTAVDHSDRGFGERHFTWVQALDDGRVLVSTWVSRGRSSDDCGTGYATRESADLYVIDSDAGAPVARFGRP